ncbi:transposase [Singulisphaera acidiphila]|uniref:Transposase family protein n=5 Tax=Singulisphaera acidiphila TaxID=466153 RepID=L0DFG9_SINAD|nr:transposase [Singulisphaera acidiphila]AGA26519.1 transposase family protein [Singulisphaera acidiphila DSM 18658]AGA27605.1 transposase family protein [Singulisphaera acidiphila DSM 18658]AGA27917.1 transposase family protein [Singulisphaera acidiphila DSM 18658]
MITIRDHQTGDLFDPWDHLGGKRRQLLERSWAGVFRDYLLEHLPVGELITRFSRQLGRPTKDLHMVLGALILQQLHDLTDAATVEAVAFNITWQYALDIRAESDAYLCERTLRNYRQWLIEKGLDQVLFRSLTDQLIKAVGTDTSKQRLDSTAIQSAMRGLTRLGIIVESISKFLRELRRFHPALHAQVDPDLVRKYVDREGNACFASTKPSESKRRLPEAATDLLALVTQLRGTTALELPSFLILDRVLSEQCEVKNDPEAGPQVRVKEPNEMPCGNVLSPADPDASYNAHRGVGFLVQIMETYSDVEDDPTGTAPPPPPDLITHVAVGPMNVHDGSSLEPALADTDARTIKPEVVLADSHYGSNENLEKAKHQGVDLVSPSMPPKGSKQEKLTLEDFELDEHGLVVRCPQGHVPITTSASADKLQVCFEEATCAACPFHKSCCASAVGRKESRYQYTYDRVRQRLRRLHNHSDEFKERYRWRSGIEGTMSRFKYQMRMASLRIRGRAAVSYASFLRALGLNIHRVAAYKAALE